MYANLNRIIYAADVCFFCIYKNFTFFTRFVIFKPLRYCFKETIAFDAKASLESRPVLRLIRWYNKPGDILKEFWEEAIQFHRTFHGLKITNSTYRIFASTTTPCPVSFLNFVKFQDQSFLIFKMIHRWIYIIGFFSINFIYFSFNICYIFYIYFLKCVFWHIVYWNSSQFY